MFVSTKVQKCDRLLIVHGEYSYHQVNSAVQHCTVSAIRPRISAFRSLDRQIVKSWHAMGTLEGRHRRFAYIGYNKVNHTNGSLGWGGMPCLHLFGRTVLAVPFTNKNKL